MSHPLTRACHAVADWAWPRTCHVCTVRIVDDRIHCLCGGCEQKLTTDPAQVCPRCSSTVGPHTDTSGGCARCRTATFRFGGVTRLGVYDGLLREAVLKMKQPGGDGLAETLGRALGLARGVPLQSAADVVIPVPLHWRRAWDRKHNQADGIARGLATVLRLPVWRRVLWRVKHSSGQPASSREQRWANAAGAFRVAPWGRLAGVRVLLVDDVLTTGATADAAAAALRTVGAAQVHVAVLAHR